MAEDYRANRTGQPADDWDTITERVYFTDEELRDHRAASELAQPARTRNGNGNSSGRRKSQKKRRSFLARLSGALLYVLFVIGVSGVLATVGWIWAGDVLSLNKPEKSATIVLPEDIFSPGEVEVKTTDENGEEQISTKTVTLADMDYVADLLEEEGLIDYKFLFKLFAKFTHANQKLSPGTYSLNTNMDYRALLTNLGRNSATRQELEVTIPEGYSIDQTFELLAEKKVASVADLQSMAAAYDYKFTWLQGVIPLGDYHRLEGYLFPDTYKFYAGEDPKYVLNKMLANFERKMEEYFDQIDQSGKTLAEIVNVAAMVEKETDGDDQTQIAGVIYNRLNNNDGGTNGYLQIDATLVYLNGGNVPTEADKAIDSPYNTYLYPGLPKGPIANPGMAALYAAMNPEASKNYFYVLGDDNDHHFFTTYKKMQSFMATQKRYQG